MKLRLLQSETWCKNEMERNKVSDLPFTFELLMFSEYVNISVELNFMFSL